MPIEPKYRSRVPSGAGIVIVVIVACKCRDTAELHRCGGRGQALREHPSAWFFATLFFTPVMALLILIAHGVFREVVGARRSEEAGRGEDEEDGATDCAVQQVTP